MWKNADDVIHDAVLTKILTDPHKHFKTNFNG